MRRQPTHPGVFFDRQVRERLGMDKTEAAKKLGVHRKTLSEFCSGKTSCTPEMALRLAVALDMNVAAWLNMQANYDAWKAENAIDEEKLHVEKFPKEARCA